MHALLFEDVGQCKQVPHVIIDKQNGLVFEHRLPGMQRLHHLPLSPGQFGLDPVHKQGDFVYETPGEAHTLIAYESDEPMLVHFKVKGPLVWLDENGDAEDFFDVHDYIRICKEHYEQVGLGADMIDALMR